MQQKLLHLNFFQHSFSLQQYQNLKTSLFDQLLQLQKLNMRQQLLPALANQFSLPIVSSSQAERKRKIAHFILYTISYFLYGQVFTCLGPLFPYLSAKEGRLQTEYTFMYTYRALGYILGSLSLKYLQQKLSLHSIISLGISTMSFFSICFYLFTGEWTRGICVAFLAIGCAYQDVAINLAVLECFQSGENAKWLQIIHGFFGIGGLMGPGVVYIFQIKTLGVLGVVSIGVVGGYCYLPTPENGKICKESQDEIKKYRPIPSNCLMIISSLFFFTVGQETSFGGWISSFAVLTRFSTKQHATLYSSLYWISITVFRFVFAFVPGSPSKKIQILASIGVLNSILNYYTIFYIHPETGLIILSLLYGLCNSALFPLLLTIPDEYGYRYSMKQTSTFITWMAVGQGCLAVGIGKMMGFVSYCWLIYGMGIMDLIIAVLARGNQMEMIWDRDAREREAKEKDIQMADWRSGNLSCSGDLKKIVKEIREQE